jgi:acetyl-CoA carboxylase biotin carboxylase subunit
VHDQAEVQPFYDSLVAKLIVKGRDRDHAIRRMLGAIDEYVVEGIATTLPVQRALIDDPLFRECTFHTRCVDAWLEARKG